MAEAPCGHAARLGDTRLWVLPLDLRLPDSLVAELLTLLKRRPS